MAKRRKKKSKLQRAKENPASRYWRNKADEAWRKAVLTRDGDRCVVCGTDRNLQVHHLFSRGRADTRHEVSNGITLCSAHHKWSREISPHKGPVAFFLWLQKNRPDQWEWLKKHVAEPENYKPDFRETYNRLRANEDG